MNEDIPALPQRHVFSVSELNNSVKRLLEHQFPAIWLEAEISNLVQPRSGHLYLTLKDDQSQLRSAMFRGNNIRLPFQPKDGMQVLVRGRLSLFAPRGDYQLIIDHMEEAGLGALQRAFEQLKAKLGAEGLFEADRKQPVPTRPRRIGVVTSATGAAIHDILSVLKRRFPLTEVVLYPSLVQGREAVNALCQAIAAANRRNECDVLIVGRGGGSLEDLWCFNDEQVARAITASKLPVVSAVGHETDFTIADFVADVRAPTPSAAAELLSADGRELLDKLSGFQTWLTEHLRRRLMEQQQTLDWLSRQLKHPGKRLQEHSRRLEELEWRLRQSIQRTLQLQQNQLHSARIRLHNQSPGMQINTLAKDIAQLEARLKRGFSQHAGNRSTQLQHLAQRLNTVSPLATLSRGYSITKTRENTILRSSDQVQRGDTIRTQLHQGALICTVEQTEKPQ
ncbi:MAG: exodeoxyribonuclease VII large subunit [Pseudomonadales bacterium]|jgi:exodeoxyribonuclease VII large subunit|uniref:exodeoxyribonuclease VII large subunit n=1 Tax=unclassified Ketobacter TaxID=2639109 RepID=UPI000C470B30|nr:MULTISPECIES: exodeoxyribonuclease VII large subunit [unclassified Ketobacter]MAQ27264.1 exodeoxyribonuclease VII large subunit [Pseudomonadales bacterium]HAG96764.1 exodeoxyribonuclease VII large subunit [Gammaproteobacteria bacterium]MBI27098.1 exodeoxyribonuclease VII large subunit [Pseudomonadales bacterium]RLT88369.1 MAG: exodeoxyribonuclease VII large subunit [Ketobacter sp. GenoA1]RLT95556.1 MAG: exodeoxyribonuclease VII large subunit [Ketobacter sp.]|tara:strand:+ start:18998 stop:20353 length:1356 start_codon:yes stop_codon:yes gene_type:complete